MRNLLRGRYRHMVDRCYNENCDSYKDYGGRGIYICDEWLNDFKAFEKWSYENGFKPELQIDRIDNDGPYAPWNCRWATCKENNQHRRSTRFYTYNGETKNLTQWCEDLNLPYGSILSRIADYGWDFEKAITTSIKKRDKTRLLGKRFGRLTVIAYSENMKGNSRNSWWVCQCDCGNVVTVRDCKLITGYTKSCGCLKEEKYPQLKRKSANG